MMTENSKTLAEIQEDCRRFAAEIGDTTLALILYRAAHDLEQYARKDQDRTLNSIALFGHCAEHDSHDRQTYGDGQHPPNGAVKPLLPFLEGLKFPLGPF
jgi:hypothetical protein